MTNFSPLRRRLTFLLVVQSVVCCSYVSAQTWDIYDRAEQTDADYESERIEELISLFASKDELERDSAFWKLEALGPEARSAIPKLIELLEDQTITVAPWGIKDDASETLFALDMDVVAALVRAFPESSAEKKRMIAQTATAMGPDARALLPLLRKEYASAKESDRLQYLWAIASVDPTGETAFPTILIALRNAEDESERKLAAECLRIQGSPEYGEWPSQARQWFQQRRQNPEIAVNALLQALRDNEPSVRGAAIDSLAGYTAYEKQIVPELIRKLDDDGEYSVMISIDLGGVEYVSDLAAGTLTSFPASAETIVPAVVRWALREGPVFKSSPERILADVIPSTTEPIKYVRQLMNSQKPELALLASARMGKAAQSLVPQIKLLTNGDDSALAMQALMTLACIDPRYEDKALKALNRELVKRKNDEEEHWSSAFLFLTQVGEQAAFAKPAAENAIGTSFIPEFEYDVYRGYAVEFLGEIGRGGSETAMTILSVIDAEAYFLGEIDLIEDALLKLCPEIIPDLKKTLRDEFSSQKQKVACLRALAAAHAENPELVPLIVAQLECDHPAVRESAVQALGEIGAKNDQSITALIEALDDPRVRVRAKALDSLAKFGDKAKPTVPQIVECLSDDYLTVRVAAVRCLGELGPTAASAVDELEKLNDSESLLLRETVEETIARIQTE